MDMAESVDILQVYTVRFSGLRNASNYPSRIIHVVPIASHFYNRISTTTFSTATLYDQFKAEKVVDIYNKLLK